MNDVYTHILEGTGRLTKYRVELESRTQLSIDRMAKFLSISSLDIVLSDEPDSIIPEIGMGGYSGNEHLIHVYLDPGREDFLQTLENELTGTIGHEVHHALRSRSVGYGKNLLEAIITEGLADHFEMDLCGIGPRPWDNALSNNELESYLEKASTIWLEDEYDHDAWFFGSQNLNILRWTGYSLGFYIMAEYFKNNPEMNAAKLIDTSAYEILKGSKLI